MVGLASAQGVELDHISGQVHFGPNQPVRPKTIDREDSPQQVGGTLLRSAAQEDDPPAQWGLQVQVPSGREPPS